jgi:hypothetical protein
LSNDRAIAAVTSTIRNLLFRAVSNDSDLAGTTVTTRPPDRARPTGSTGNQINLFMYRTSIDAAWRNQDPPGIRPGESGQPPLPLVLSYLMTAYGEDDEEVLAHRLLGVGMQMLNDQPLLSPAAIAAALPGSGLESQPDRVRITPHPIPMDEISRLWTTFGTGYRISASYDAAVVLIDNTQPLMAPLPVLVRSPGDKGPVVSAQGPPMLLQVLAPNGQAGARPNDEVVLSGRGLAGVSEVRLSGGALSDTQSVPVSPVSDGAVRFKLPTGDVLAAGILGVTAVVDDDNSLTSNAVPLSVVPEISNLKVVSGTVASGSVTISVDCSPAVVATQTVALVVGNQIVDGPTAETNSAPRTSLTFTLPGVTAGSYVLRLRVDGQDSIPGVAGTSGFDPNQTLELS